MAQVKILKTDSDGVPVGHDSASDEITFVSGQFGNVKASGNTIISTDTNGGLTLTPDGTGDLTLDGVKWPQADGSLNQVLKTDGSGQASWASPSDDTEAEQVVNSYTADEALLIRDFLYISAADNVSKCDASDGTITSRGMGFAQAAASDTSSVPVVSEGVLAGFTGLTAGARYYADPSSAGAITATLPVGTGNTIVAVGYAKSSTAIHIHIEQLGRRP